MDSSGSTQIAWSVSSIAKSSHTCSHRRNRQILSVIMHCLQNHQIDPQSRANGRVRVNSRSTRRRRSTLLREVYFRRKIDLNRAKNSAKSAPKEFISSSCRMEQFLRTGLGSTSKDQIACEVTKTSFSAMTKKTPIVQWAKRISCSHHITCGTARKAAR